MKAPINLGAFLILKQLKSNNYEKITIYNPAYDKWVYVRTS